MPALKCASCKRWSFETGCSLYSYGLMKKCMIDEAEYYIPADSEQENERSAENAEGN